ncbi:MAG: glycosyltransferase [Bacteroidales bacterium]|nr:glycosyltransferase [Bacteroidales bacterium]
MISIITTVYNQLGMNKLFLEYLEKNTTVPYELIIIDNNSEDGSGEFFKGRDNVVVIRNDGNYSYPYTQNQGIKAAKYDILAFFNNDIIVSKNWDVHLLEVLSKHNLETVSFATNDRIGPKSETKRFNKKWRMIKYPMNFFFGTGYESLKWMFRLMYPDYNTFTEKRFDEWGLQIEEGFSGCAIVMKKSAIDKIGLWDERIQGADYDFYCRTKERWNTHKDIIPLSIAKGIYFHHYQRLTLKAKFPPFADRDNLISLSDKWGGKEALYMKDLR